MLNFKPKSVAIAILMVANFVFSLAFAAEGKEEVLLGIKITAETIELKVASSGCTKKEDFSIEVNEGVNEQSPYVLTVRRNRRDECKAWLSEGITVEFTKDELGIDEVRAILFTNKRRMIPEQK